MPFFFNQGLTVALHASWQATAGVALAAGVASHHLLVFAYVGAVAVMLVSYVQTGGYQLTAALIRVMLVANAYNIGAVTSILVYRAFFHPPRRFPGPFSARLSRFYALRKLIESHQGYTDVQKLHQEYGDIVRVGKSRHAQIWNHCFIAPYLHRNTTLTLFHVCFSQDVHLLKSTNEHPAIQGVHESMFFIGVVGTVPWLLYMIGKIPGLTSYNRFYMWCNQQLEDKRKAMTSEKEILGNQETQDVMSWLFKARDEELKRAPLTDLGVQEDARLLILAGRLHFLAKNPHSYQRLQAAVQEQTKTIRYLDYAIQETLRLRPSVPVGVPREVPQQGLTIDSEFIPGGTIVAVPTYTIQRDGRHWEDPLAFKPERWEKLSTEKSPWIPFSRGHFVCPGGHLAMMGLPMVLSRIALQYDVAFPLGQNGESDMELINGLTAEQTQAILIYLCKDGSVASKVRSYAEDMKTNISLNAICVQCDLIFNPSFNLYKECRYHSGQLEVDWHGDFWADHDENCHGIIDMDEMREEYPEGFVWTCCNKEGGEEGCRSGRHQTDISKSKKGMDFDSEKDAELEPDEENDDEDGEDEEDEEDEDAEDVDRQIGPNKRQKCSV
ncbi:cytochrome P450 [Trichoderma ceciliae]